MPDEIYRLLRVAGGDAKDFLQGQLTQDIELVDRRSCLPAAWCNPKGRVITILRALKFEDGYGLILPAALANAVADRLSVYRLRADVSLEVTEWECRVITAEEDFEELGDLRPPRAMNACRNSRGLVAFNIGIEERCLELMGSVSALAKISIRQAASAECLRGARIRAGIPEILETYSEKFTPHMLNLDLIGAISFDKGCYTGQEVVARTENLGKSKRRLMRYSSDAPLGCGDKLSDGEKDVGEVINAAGNDLLAVTPVDSHAKTLVSGGVEVTPVTLPYC